MSDNNAILKLLAGQTTRLSHVETQLEEAKNIIRELIEPAGKPVSRRNRAVRFLNILEGLDNE